MGLKINGTPIEDLAEPRKGTQPRDPFTQAIGAGNFTKPAGPAYFYGDKKIPYNDRLRINGEEQEICLKGYRPLGTDLFYLTHSYVYFSDVISSDSNGNILVNGIIKRNSRVFFIELNGMGGDGGSSEKTGIIATYKPGAGGGAGGRVLAVYMIPEGYSGVIGTVTHTPRVGISFTLNPSYIAASGNALNFTALAGEDGASYVTGSGSGGGAGGGTIVLEDSTSPTASVLIAQTGARGGDASNDAGNDTGFKGEDQPATQYKYVPEDIYITTLAYTGGSGVNFGRPDIGWDGSGGGGAGFRGNATPCTEDVRPYSSDSTAGGTGAPKPPDGTIQGGPRGAARYSLYV